MSQEGDMPRRLQTMPGRADWCPRDRDIRARDGAGSGVAATLPRGWGSCRVSIRQGASRGWKGSKMGQRDIRRLLITGAMAVIRWASRQGRAPRDSWLARMMERKPPMVVAVALANKMARGIWAMLTRDRDYRNPAIADAE